MFTPAYKNNYWNKWGVFFINRIKVMPTIEFPLFTRDIMFPNGTYKCKFCEFLLLPVETIFFTHDKDECTFDNLDHFLTPEEGYIHLMIDLWFHIISWITITFIKHIYM